MSRSTRPSNARRLALALSVTVALPVAVAHAQRADRGMWAQPVSVLLDQHAAVAGTPDALISPDSYCTGCLSEGSLNDGESTVLTFTLRGHQHYTFAGVCDDDCTDLDLRLYDENYNLVAADTDLDPTPIVGVTPRHTGTFYLRVTMASCNVNPCGWQVW